MTAAQLAACTDLLETAACTADGLDGECRIGICVAQSCGDGFRTGTEICEGDELGGASCAYVGYWGETSGLRCRADCSFDFAGCGSEFCGDGAINGPEVCEAGQPLGLSCLDLGFDRGTLACGRLCSPEVHQCAHIGWQAQVQPTYDALLGIWGASETDVHVVGALGTILHYDGTSFVEVASPVTTGLTRIHGTAANDIFAVGDGGSIVHYDGTSWSAMTSGVTGNLIGVWARTPADVYAVGVAGTVLRYDGTAWSPAPAGGSPPPAGAVLFSVWADATRVYVGGTNGGTRVIYRLQGGTWTQQALSASPGAVLGLWGSGPSDIYAVGADTNGLSPGFVARFNGSTWSPVATTARGAISIAGRSATDLAAVGFGGQIYESDGTGWRTLQAVPDTVNAIWLGETRAFAVGASGKILVADRTRLFSHRRPSWQINATWALARNDVIAVGSPALPGEPAVPSLYRYDGTTWSPLGFTGHSLVDVHAAGPNAIFGVGYSAIRFNGTWAELPAVPRPMRAVWAFTANNAMVAGEDGAVFRWNGSSWIMLRPIQAGQNLSGIYAFSPTDVYVVGDGGAFLHWDGSTLTQIAHDLPAPVDLTAIWGAGPQALYLGTCAVDVYRWDGATATLIGTGAPVRRIWGTSDTDVFVVSSGAILHFDGATWSPIRQPEVEFVRSVHGSESSVYFAAGTEVRELYRPVAW